MSQRYHTETAAIVPGSTQTVAGLTPARLVTGAFAFATGSQIAIALAGAILWIAWTGGTPHREASKWILLASSTPWLIAALILLRITWSYLFAVLELVLGQDLDQSGMIGDITSGVEQIRLIPVRGTERMIDQIPEEDLLDFIEQLPVKGISGRSWLGYKLSSGREVDWEYLKQLCQVLEKANILRDRGARKSGYLVTTDPEEIKQALKLQ